MSSEPKMPASGRMGMLVKPKQSQTGVMCVARARCVAFPGAKVESVIEVLMAQASWNEWKLTGSIFRLPAGATFRQRPHWLHSSKCMWIWPGWWWSSTRAPNGQESRIALKIGGVEDFLGEPVLVVVHHVVHRAARVAGQAAQGQVLDGAAKAAAWVALDMGEVDQEAGVFDHAGDMPILDRLVGVLGCVYW